MSINFFVITLPGNLWFRLSHNVLVLWMDSGVDGNVQTR